MHFDDDGTHEPVLVHWDDLKLSVPGEVCWTCSDELGGRWVPVPFCPAATARMARESGARSYIAETAHCLCPPPGGGPDEQLYLPSGHV